MRINESKQLTKALLSKAARNVLVASDEVAKKLTRVNIPVNFCSKFTIYTSGELCMDAALTPRDDYARTCSLVGLYTVFSGFFLYI